MIVHISIILILLILLIIFWYFNIYNVKICNLRVELRKLWMDHGIYTRKYINDALNEDPNLDITAIRLMKNQDDIGNFIGSVYGKDYGNKLSILLKDHINIAANIVKSYIKQENKEMLLKDWQKNAADISKLLNRMNLKWNYDELLKHMLHHLELTGGIVDAQYNKNKHKEIEMSDQAMKQLLDMSDYLYKNLN